MKDHFSLNLLLATVFAVVLIYVTAKAQISPYIKNIYLSKSVDGLTLSYPVGPLITSSPYPTGGYFDDGYLRLFAEDGVFSRYIRFVKTKDGRFIRGLKVLKSKDGLNFEKEKFVLDTFPINFAQLSKPYLIKTEDEMWRLYLLVLEREEDKVSKPIHSLVSQDGINWRYEGRVIDYDCADPVVVYLQRQKQYLLYCPFGSEGTLVGFSSDGKKFSPLQNFNLPAIFAAVEVEGGFLFYFDRPSFGLTDHGVFFSTNGVRMEQKFDLPVPINEPAIVRMSDGLYHFYSAFPLSEIRQFEIKE